MMQFEKLSINFIEKVELTAGVLDYLKKCMKFDLIRCSSRCCDVVIY